MSRRNGMAGNVALSMLIGLLVAVAPALAQQQEPQQPTPAPAEPKPTNAKDGKDPKEKGKQGKAVGKRKVEKETGTVNDRIFEVLPNYGTVENANELPPLTSGQKFRLATASVFDWGAYPFNGVLAAIAQAKNDPKEWGQGWDAYGKRYGASFADNSIGTYMTTAIFPSLLHEDPRYYQLGKGRFVHAPTMASIGFLLLARIRGMTASTTRNRSVMRQPRRFPTSIMCPETGRHRETRPHLVF